MSATEQKKEQHQQQEDPQETSDDPFADSTYAAAIRLNIHETARTLEFFRKILMAGLEARTALAKTLIKEQTGLPTVNAEDLDELRLATDDLRMVGIEMLEAAEAFEAEVNKVTAQLDGNQELQSVIPPCE